MHVQMGDARKHPVGCNRLYTTVRLRFTCKLSAHPKRRLYGCMIYDTSLRIDLRIICRPPAGSVTVASVRAARLSGLSHAT